MNPRLQDLRHELHVGSAVYLVLRQPLGRAQFDAIIGIFAARHAAVTGQTAMDAYWDSLVERAAGRTPWSHLRPRYTGPDDTIEAIRQIQSSVNTLDNILTARPYAAFEIDGLKYTLDLFNPADELRLGYRGAGEPVLVLLFRGSEPAITQDQLVPIASFYQVLAEVDRIVAPQYVRGEHSFEPIAIAYAETRLPLGRRPWDLLFGLSVLDSPLESLPDEVHFYCAKIETWGAHRTLIQVLPGFSAQLAPEYENTAHALGMTAVQELIQDLRW
jgi:hypothetical protein